MHSILFLRCHARLKSRLRAAVMWQMHVINKPSFVLCSFQIIEPAVAVFEVACSRRSDSGERCEVKRSPSTFYRYLYFAPLSTIWTLGTGYNWGYAWFYCLLRSYKSTFQLCGLSEQVKMLLLSRIKNGYDCSATTMYFERFWFRFYSKHAVLCVNPRVFSHVSIITCC